jgi:hypothetical protein
MHVPLFVFRNGARVGADALDDRDCEEEREEGKDAHVDNASGVVVVALGVRRPGVGDANVSVEVTLQARVNVELESKLTNVFLLQHNK